jgi:hypothetical protein
MKKLCILCPIDNVEEVKSKFKRSDILHIDVSPTGELPATHKFCSMPTNEERTKRYLALQELTTMEEVEDSSKFLESKNLKVIKSK